MRALSALLAGISFACLALHPGSAASAPVPTQIAVPADAADCSAVPGAVVHDDGTYESGFGGWFKTVDTSEFVDRFDPPVRPSTLDAVCVAFAVQGPEITDFQFNVRIYAMDGPDGAPGTLLGEVPATLPQIAPYEYGAQGAFFRVDISMLNLVLNDEVYVGVEWNDMAYPGSMINIASDAESGGPLAGGYHRNTFTPWTPLYFSFLSSYRALLIRTIARAPKPILAVERNKVETIDHCAANPEQGNGVAEPGEEIDLQVPVLASAGGFGGVTLRLALPAPPGVQYRISDSALGSIAEGASATGLLRIALEPGVQCMQDIELLLQMDSDQGTFYSTFPLEVGRSAKEYGPAVLPLKIPEPDEEGIESSIQIPTGGNVEELAVSVRLKHYTVGDIILRLRSPSGTVITLLDRPGYPPFPGCENEVNSIFFMDGEADPEDVCDPDGGMWPAYLVGPTEPLATFAGEDMQGTWTLITADVSSGNTGALEDWSLHLTPAPSDACSICGAAGNEAIFANGFDAGP
ncbi:MAG: proprotein convertase P-domain-containing protein [Xanthomonadales bacterium]|nr:proprotein convertase P-domain-containing protein [Xanthomonadales bacterium]